MADKSQLSLRDFFSKANPDEFRSQICSSDSTPASFIPLVAKEEQKKYQKGRKRQNMRDSRNCRKIKDIAEGRRDTEGKVIKNHPDALNKLNRMGEKDQNFSHVIYSCTNNLRPFAQKQKQIGNTDVEKKAYIQSRA